MNVNRIREALGETFQQAHLSLDPKSVLVSHASASEQEEDGDSYEDHVEASNANVSAESDTPKAYKLAARITLVHED
jgi:hypothetical protein